MECEQAEGNDHRIGPDVAYQCPPCREVSNPLRPLKGKALLCTRRVAHRL